MTSETSSTQALWPRHEAKMPSAKRRYLRLASVSRVAPQQRYAPPVSTAALRDDSHDVLPRDYLIAQLRRERLRVDRSGARLSLVIFRLAKSDDSTALAKLRSVLVLRKRETDIVGHLDNGAVAVICPDTGDDGVRSFVAKIDANAGDLPYSVDSATYPDQLFDRLSEPPDVERGPCPLLLSEQDLPSGGAYLLKRGLDVIGALAALAVLSPLMAFTALAVKVSSRGPVIFRQDRLGKGGTPFAFYKFRSMVVDSDDRIHREYVESLIKGHNDACDQRSEGSSPHYKMKADPRVTWIGRVIRKTSIDELPQLFNVLKGDMSLVGPRPPIPYEVENYRSWHVRRVLSMKPGITGLWQVEGRSKVSFDDMVRMDLRYIRNCSLSLDLRILAKTVTVVAKGVGAG